MTLAMPHWAAVLWPAVPWIEKIVRPVLVYVFLLVAFRVSSKRELAQATLFDFLTMLLIANAVQNAMIGEDNSVAGAFGGTVALLVLSWALNHMTARSHQAREMLEGAPTVLIYNGQVLTHNRLRDSVGLNDLYSGLREAGVVNLSEVRLAILELDGNITVIRTDGSDHPLTAAGSVLTPDLLRQLPAEPAGGAAAAS